MRSIRKILVRVCIVLVFLMLLNQGSRFLLESRSNSSIYAKKDRMANDGTIDTVFVGTSLIYMGVNPQVMDEKLGVSTFNVATPNQPLTGSYYMLKDVCSKNPVKRVFLGVGIASMMQAMDRNVDARLGVADRLTNWGVRLEYIFKDASYEEWMQFFFYPARVDNLFDLRAMKTNIEYKTSSRFKENLSPEYWNSYGYKGWQKADKIFDGKVYVADFEVWDPDKMFVENREVLCRIAEFCKEEGIELNLVLLPTTQAYSQRVGDIDGMHEFYQEAAEECGVRLYDFMQYPQIHEILTDDKFFDKKHLNIQGAEIFSNLLADCYLEEREW